MKSFYIQITPQGLRPAAEEDWDIMREEYATNERIKCNSFHVNKVLEASVIQGNLLHACFKLVAENNDKPNMATPKQVKFACKMGIGFYNYDVCGVRPDGVVVFDLRSFAHDKLKGKDRLGVIDKAFVWLAGIMGVTVDEMVAEAQSRMTRR